MSDKSQQAQSVLGNLKAVLPDLESVYKDIHSHPELSMQEKRTAGIAADRLRAAGYEVTTRVGDHKGYAAIWQDMVAYAETLPAWQPGDGNYWCRAERLAVNLLGLSEIAPSSCSRTLSIAPKCGR